MSEQKSLDMEKLRKEIEKIVNKAIKAWLLMMAKPDCENILRALLPKEYADQILAIILTPEIVASWIKEHPEAGYVELDKDQTLPDVLPFTSSSRKRMNIGFSTAHEKALKEAGFRRVKQDK